MTKICIQWSSCILSAGKFSVLKIEFEDISFTENGDIEMGRLITGSMNPTVLYVSGGNTQVGQVKKILRRMNFY